MYRQCLLEFMCAAVGVEPGLGQGGLHGRQGGRAWTVRIFVRRQLDDIAEPVFALQFADRLARHIRRKRKHGRGGQLSGMSGRVLVVRAPSLQDCARVGANDPEQRGLLLEALQCACHGCVTGMALDVDEKHVVPLTAA